MIRIALRGLLLVLLSFSLSVPVRADDPDWTWVPVPGVWEDAANGQFAKHDGFAWYRCQVVLPETWRDEDVYLVVDAVDNAQETYVNGRKTVTAGAFPPSYRNGLADRSRTRLDAKLLKPGQKNLVAIRVYDHDGKGGFKGGAPQFIGAQNAIVLKGDWQFRTGDDLAWATSTDGLAAEKGVFDKLTPISALKLRPTENLGPLSPQAALKSLQTPDDLAVDLVLSEPLIAQPVFMTFDAKGRMWVVQYRQYPHPAGLKMVSRDQFWRAVYDKVPLPPPQGVKGKDRITIHEDTDGDGQYDKHQTFVDGLNIATSCVPDPDGVWVLNPPYLLHYADADHNDVPDGDPVVHLEGFGLEDTHSVANSLRFGPDGWLYGAQGSTVTGNIRKPGEKSVVYSQGQLIWRYHPPTKRYEVFAEGGGNAFGVEIDSHGRIFSGHNGGDTRGFHYMQGAYLQKGFSKHGPLSNPYAFGYFPPMQHKSVPRFTHTFTIYDGDVLPARYKGKLFGVAPLLNYVVFTDLIPDRSTFRTEDLGYTISTADPWFRPVDIKPGPDGNLYVADWYDAQTNHFRNHEGQMDASNGRIYRIRPRDWQPSKPVDMTQWTTDQLLAVVLHPESVTIAPGPHAQPWHRRMALHLLGGRVTPKERVRASAMFFAALQVSEGLSGLAALWGLNAVGDIDEATALDCLKYPEPAVREWTVRLLGDARQVTPALALRLAELAKSEPNLEVRCQLACSARRLPAAQTLPILHGLLQHSEDVSDPRLPLLIWWALESKCDADRDIVFEFFKDTSLWSLPLVQQHLLPRLLRRYAATGTRRDLQFCAKFLNLAPTAETAAALLKGFEDAFQGRALGQLPEELLEALARRGGGSDQLALRLGKPEALERALILAADIRADRTRRLDVLQVLSELHPPSALPVLRKLLAEETDPDLQATVLAGLGRYPANDVGQTILDALPKLSPEAKVIALSTLVSRSTWTRLLLAAVTAGQVPKTAIPLDTVRRMTIHRDPQIAALIEQHWGSIAGATTAQMQVQIDRVKQLAASGTGTPYAGKKLFAATCAKCHKLHGLGGQIGPDLTTFKRDDLDTMLLNIINPSAEIREGFESFIAIDQEGRAVTGFLVEQDPQVIVLRTPDGQTATLRRDQLDEFAPQKKSLMPEGLLDPLTPQQTRDLLAYLRSTQPLND